MIVLPSGPRAFLVEFDTLDEVQRAAAHWRRCAVPGVVDLVPAARTVLVVHDGSVSATALDEPGPGEVVAPGAEVVVPVRYDGVDLAEVAGRCGLTADEVVHLHTGASYTVAFCGFRPGFSYLVGLPEALHLPRLDTPRQRVAAGSVAIAAGYSAVYPDESPGGWHLLGSTDMPMWDELRDPPATLPPGTTVRFEAR